MKTVTRAVRTFGERPSLAIGAVVCAILFVAAYVLGTSPATILRPAADGPQGPILGDQDFEYWTSAGSAGTVDEVDAGLVAFTGPAVSIQNSAPASSNLLIRYNVTANDNLSQSGDQPFIQARFRDNGEDARIIVRLRQVSIVTGVNSLLLTIDSDDYAPSGIYQTQFVDADAGTLPFSFNAYILYVEVTIVRGSAEGNPAVLGVLVGRY